MSEFADLEAIDGRLIEGLSYEPLVVQAAKQIQGSSDPNFVELDSEAVQDHLVARYGVSHDQAHMALGMAIKREEDWGFEEAFRDGEA